MAPQSRSIPILRKPNIQDFKACLALGVHDFRAAPRAGVVFASFFAVAGMGMAVLTYLTGQTFWLVLAVLGFPLIGTLGAVGFYDISRRLTQGEPVHITDVVRFVWALRTGQLPWLATIIVVIFLFWFFLGHMIFALFLGLSPMVNISTSFGVFLSSQGIMMMSVGSLIGAFFAILVFALSIHAIPMLVDRDIDFMTAALTSIAAVADSFSRYVVWGAFIAAVTMLSMLPFFLGLFITVPVFGHATWHLYKRLST